MHPDADPHRNNLSESGFEVLDCKINKPRIMGEPIMMITYCWELEGVERDHKTIASRMICFREKVFPFRVGLKNGIKPTLLFMSTNLNEIGMMIREVVFHQNNSSGGDNRQTMNHSNLKDQVLDLFTFDLPTMIVGSCTFVFSIWLEGSMPGCYSYELSDRLAKQQLWAASSQSQHLVDVEFVCRERRFSAHKAILAARSPVFAAEFEKMANKDQTTDDPPLQIHIDDVDESVLEEFLYFLYTGEALKISLASKQLRDLAKRYQLNSLLRLCENALVKVDVMQMASFVSNLDLDPQSSPLRIRPDKDTQLNFGDHETTYRCVWIFEGRRAAEQPLKISYQNENLFSLHLKDEIVHFISVNNHPKSLNQVLYSTNKQQWHKMKPKNPKHKLEKFEMLFFVAKCDEGFFDRCSQQTITFDIKINNTIEDYRYEMMDVLWKKQLWNAAVNKQLTDVHVFVGNKLVMEAHQVVLSARSPVLCDLLNKIEKRNGKAAITFDADMDHKTVEHFLYFLYTGSSEINFNNKQYLRLAENHGVKTLTEVCKLATVSSPDGNEITNFLLTNF